MTLTRRNFVLVATAGSLALAGCTGGGGSSGDGDQRVQETTDVSMTGSQFQPRNIHVAAGATVTWMNQDSTEHTVTSASENWDVDQTVPGGESTTHNFEESGVYDVYCTIHGSADLSGMSMKVGVGEATIENPVGGDAGDGGGGMY